MDEQNAPLISVVLPTFNRAELLDKALKSIAAAVTRAASKIEVIVVDNNCTDNTATVVESAAKDFPCSLKRVNETSQGLSYARNRGTQEAQGFYIAFMDDDQLMEINYLSNLPRAFEQTHATCVGGPLTYYNADDMPRWLKDLSETIGQISFGEQVKILGPDTHKGLFGGTMVLIKDELIKAGGFNVNLGRSGNDAATGEDFELQDRLRKLGKTVAYHPDLIQYHYLRAERYQKNYWRRYFYDFGRSAYKRNVLDNAQTRANKSRRLLGSPIWLWRELIATVIPKYLASFLSLNRSKIFRAELEAWTTLGKMNQAAHPSNSAG